MKLKKFIQPWSPCKEWLKLIIKYLFQVRELQDEVDEFKEKCSEMEREKEGVALQLQQAKAKADSEALSRDAAIQCCRQIHICDRIFHKSVDPWLILRFEMGSCQIQKIQPV